MIIKNEKGSISLYVLISLLSLLLIIIGIYVALSNSEVGQLEAEQRIKEIYGEGVNNIEDVYQTALQEELKRIEKLITSDGSWDSTQKVNTPKLTSDMEPIYWTGTEWEVATTNEQWYNYENNLWANARTEDGSMWVWIPRYEYKIDSTGVETDYTKAGTIDVKFINARTKTPTEEGYTIHPAFGADIENGGWGEDIPGIWVAKFEMSMETNEAHTETSDATVGNIATANVLIANNQTSNGVRAVSKPGVSSWRNINIANCYDNSFYYDRDKESHLIKNSEWGAVAYLTHSKYGRIGVEVTVNNNGETYYTGGGTGTAYITNVNQSSTGNVTGIYDLSGNAAEYVASFNKAYSGDYFTGADYLNAKGTHFASTEGSGTKYVTAYSNSTETASTDFAVGDVSNIGDAIHELYVTSGLGWFSDYSNFVTSTYPFFTRGDYYNSGDGAGVFSSSNNVRHC